ncbi:uncharacterized protein [Lepisosteus oculatus]|uniref:uncharacterized protein isoform X2 n=1 Tax=Lepisosteus oculatus TaxID=7918 RepID=UPI0035F518BF
MASCVVLLLLQTCLYIAAEGQKQRPAVGVNSPVLTLEGFIIVTCVAPESVRGISCELYRHTDPSVFRTLKVSGNECLFTVSGTELLQGLRQTGLYNDIDLSCEYRDPVSRSQRSDKTTVQVLDDPPKPELRVSPAVVRETDSVELSCEGPQSVSVSHCSFYTEGARLTESHPACRRSFTGAQLATGGRRSVVRRVQLRCQYLLTVGQVYLLSPRSKAVTLTVMDLGKPSVSVSTRGPETLVLCEAPSEITGAVFHLRQPHSRASLGEEQAAAGESAVSFHVPHSPDYPPTYCCVYQYRNISSEQSDCAGAEQRGSVSLLWRHVLSALVLVALVGFVIDFLLTSRAQRGALCRRMSWGPGDAGQAVVTVC